MQAVEGLDVVWVGKCRREPQPEGSRLTRRRDELDAGVNECLSAKLSRVPHLWSIGW